MLCVDDTVLVEELRDIQHIMDESKRACDRMGLKINVHKNIILMTRREQMVSCKTVMVRWEEIKEMD